MWMPAQTTTPPRASARRAAGTSSPDRREDDRGVELLRPRLVRRARPLAAELEREPRGRVVSRPHEAEHAPSFVTRDLDDDVRRGAEAVEPEPLGIAREAQRAVADQPGAEERRHLQVVVLVRQRQAVALVGDDPLRVAAVEVVAREARRLAEVLAAGEAVAARPVGPAEPGHAEPAPVLVAADDLVPGNERELRVRQLAVDDVEVGAADTAGRHAQQDLSRPRLGPRRRPRAAAAPLPREAPSRAYRHRLIRPRPEPDTGRVRRSRPASRAASRFPL